MNRQLSSLERRHPTAGPGGTGGPNEPRSAFSLIEILVVVALLSVIILGLVAMFGQTQRAFRTGMTQSDVLAAGRLVSDMSRRELEQIAPAHQFAPNFYAQVPRDANYNTPFVQPLPGSTFDRTNLIHDLFFVSKRNRDWVATGYFVRVSDPVSGNLSLSPLGVGTLYRFETNAAALSGRTVADMFIEFDQARLNENRATRVAEGVVAFKVRTFDTNGTWIVTNYNFNIIGTNRLYPAATIGGEIDLYQFWSNAVPAAVELELGILEDKVWQRFKAQPAIAQYKYLTNQVGRVHLFRQRVAVRSLDPIAYQ